jgi:NADPH-dependent FMN reductase
VAGVNSGLAWRLGNHGKGKEPRNGRPVGQCVGSSRSNSMRVASTASTFMAALSLEKIDVGWLLNRWLCRAGPRNASPRTGAPPCPGGTTPPLRHQIARADAVLFATPEYNASVPGALMNVLDWISRPIATNVLRNKAVAVIGASTGLFGATWAPSRTAEDPPDHRRQSRRPRACGPAHRQRHRLLPRAVADVANKVARKSIRRRSATENRFQPRPIRTDLRPSRSKVNPAKTQHP